MKKIIITEEERSRIRGLYEQSKKLKDIYKQIINISYKDESSELRLPVKWGMSDLDYTYEQTPNEFWFSFDEYFKDRGQNPPTKVYIGDKEITRPK